MFVAGAAEMQHVIDCTLDKIRTVFLERPRSALAFRKPQHCAIIFFRIADNYASMAHDKYRNFPRARNNSSIRIAQEKDHPWVEINISVEICR
jgi:hypothetical protein